MTTYQKNIILFGIKSVLKSKKNFDFLNKTKIKSHGYKVTDFCDKEIPKMESNHTCVAVISLDSALNKYRNYYPQLF